MSRAEMTEVIDAYDKAWASAVRGVMSGGSGSCLLCSVPSGYRHEKDCPMWGVICARALHCGIVEGKGEVFDV